jgi:endonuclease I
MIRIYRNLATLVAFLCFFLSVWADAPLEYYKSADGKKKAELKSAFHNIIRRATVLDYGSGADHTWAGFYQTDRFNGNQVRDRYSYGVFYFPSNHVSAASGMNIEHSFPKSWWGGNKNQAYQDLFNLMPCEISINTTKSNYAMGVVTTVKETNGCTKVGKGSAGNKTANLWEPADEWKGDFARSYFYMVTAYSDLTWTGEGLTMLEQDEWPTLQRWAYELFLKWNRQDPVDDIERQRNEAVYGIQGNRNPFVDFPNLAEYIWGDSVDYAFDVNGTTAKPVFEVTPESADFAAEAGQPSEPVLVTVVMKSTKSNLFTIVASEPFVLSDDPDADEEDWSQRMVLSGSKTGSSFYVRLSAQEETGDYTGTLILTTTGVDNLILPLSAHVSENEVGVKDLMATKDITDDAWYTLSGTRLSGEPKYRGIYIRRGRKVIR